MYLRSLLPALAIAMAVAAPASARDEKAAKACAAKLTPEGKLMYNSVAGEMKPDTDLRTLMREKAIPMVMFGSLSRESAQEHGPAAGACAALLK